ncbi:MAG TPA: sigma-70 family RNA polymerase sigma factor [Verrucomicrobiae bacterium]
MISDLDLLRQFARENSQDAFTEIVRRHVNLVYSAALRQVRSPQLAEDISQFVFADLARDAGKLSNAAGGPPVLTAWLYSVARRTAIDVIRKESRRQLREQIAVEMNDMNATANDWTQIEPLLDDAMAALDETDRSAILLRYFENKSLREVGEALGASEDAAQKRVSRAVERLREFFSKRNVTIGAGGLTVLISANAVQSAPLGLAATISAVAVLAGTAAHTSTAIAAAKIIAMTTLQKTIFGATLAVVAGTGIFEAHQAAQLRGQNQRLQQQLSPLTSQIQQLEREHDDATNQLAGLLAENSRLKSNQNMAELLKLRGEVSVLQRQLESQNAKIGQQSGTKLPVETTTRLGGLVSKDRLVNVGFQTPESAFQTYLSAMFSGQFDQVVAAMPSELQPQVNTQESRKQFEDQQARPEMRSQRDNFQGMQILAKKAVSDDKVDLQTIIFENDKSPDISIEHMVKNGDEWKYAGSASYDQRSWNQATNVEAVSPFANQ